MYTILVDSFRTDEVARGTKLNTQRGYNEMTSALLAQREWAASGLETDLLKMINLMRYVHMWNNTRKMDRYINRDLNNRYNSADSKANNKTIIDLALNSYIAERTSSPKQKEQLDPRKYALSQMKVFIFAGHDTKASTICYSLLLLSRNPKAMAKLRAEHDTVLGSDRSQATSVLVKSLTILNKLPYPLAVIKETLRLFPAVSSPIWGREISSSLIQKIGTFQPKVASYGLITTDATSIRYGGREWTNSSQSAFLFKKTMIESMRTFDQSRMHGVLSSSVHEHALGRNSS